MRIADKNMNSQNAASSMMTKIRGSIINRHMRFSEKLKACRKNAHLTQSQVAEQLHVSRKTISGWENDHSFPDVTSLIRLGDIYNIPLDDLLRDDRLLKHYDDADKVLSKSNRRMHVTYFLNSFLLILGYVDYMRPFGMRMVLIPILILVNSLVLLASFTDWQRFNSKKLRISIVITFLVSFVFNIMLNAFVPGYISDLNHAIALGGGGLIGETAGRLLTTLIIILSLIQAIFLKPVKHSNKEK
ncbi:helix-turn-helix domain-containing protein [Lactiplantibacillus plantarum]|uniref:helix-turn-helix domain-containing protein n=1 Tax=Lactiplantibacillus plantarum TaxID=1590 RepID=UPI000AF28B01|nr:helix-turn-helix transcriptional regulator [Lactiplantibacillus plantarum]MCG0834589.1 XRE family transcriptional regulator [Lactiplantibacillus plantarum]MCW6117151.1 helix-turn-helix domain-containing protein [Lactiplantibacillus plantarum]BEI48747.1 Cro/Cl family transcriptional regulator [Lactiplantibacillus plantarum]